MPRLNPLYRLIGLLVLLTLVAGWTWPRLADAQDVGPLPLSAYPRPPQDNGLGIHWSTNIYGQSREIVDYFVAEMVAMGIKWVKFLNDGTEGRHNEYLIEQLVAHGMMPVMRIYQKCNKPLDLGSLRRLVQHYRPKGVFYYELYNEPELEGEAGGWCHGERPDPERMADMWVPAARVVQEEGGFPSLPSMFPPSTKDPNWQNSFFIRFLRRIKDTGNTSVLYRSWGAIHNYFLNHPLRYPYDEANLKGTPLRPEEISRYGLSPAEVEAINRARAIARRPRAEGGYYVGSTIDEDNSCFLQFLAYRNRFYEIFGFEIPLISTEGGATVGSSEDPRYPRVTPAIQAEMTIQALEYMLDEAPPYYFAFTTWLLAERAMDHFNPTWESWAWYKNREGDHLPVVDALKSHPRRGQARRFQPGAVLWNQPAQPPAVATPLVFVQPTAPTAAVQPRATPVGTAPLPLSAYPRPARDNGWGIHWPPVLFSQPPDVVDRLLSEVEALGLRWIKLIQADEPKLQHTYLIDQLVRRDIMPVLRVYRPWNEPYQHLSTIVREGLAHGVFYYELYNEPNIAGEAGGWRPGEAISVARIADLWIPAAREIAALGGYPGLPTLAPGGSYDDMRFLDEFLGLLQQRGALDTLHRAWVPLHNYFFNHPLDYPEDPVNRLSVPLTPVEIHERGLSAAEVAAINHARQIARWPRSQGGYYVGDTIDEDSNGFRKFEAYRNIVYRRLGRELPIITTEGGAIVGSQEDPRYPRVTELDVAQRTRAAFQYMIDQAPAYYFAFMPWLLANLDGGGGDAAWESAAWYPVGGRPRPVVEAIKELAAQGRTRCYLPVSPSEALSPTASPWASPPATQLKPEMVFVPPTPKPQPSSPAVAPAPTYGSTISAQLSPPAIAPVVREVYLLIPTYPYEQALVPTTPDDPIYPYPRLDFNQLGPPVPRTYRAVILENSYLRLVLLPELGGRIYQWMDKASGRPLLYQNPVIKPTRWGYRGWWIGAGGLEWAFPVEEHGFHEYQPWDYQIRADGRQAAVTLTRVDERTGLRAEVAVSLDAVHAYFTISPRLVNPTSSPQRYQFWLNAMLAPSGNSVSHDTQFVWPSDTLVVHSSSDPAFPAGEQMRWPMAGGRNLRAYAEWPDYLGFFTIPQRNFMGVYDGTTGMGIVRLFPAQVARGAKFFAGPGLDPRLWTDDESRYLELWGGVTPDFNTYAELPPGQAVGWTERWYATGRIGPVVWASDKLALGLGLEADKVIFGLTATSNVRGRLQLWQDEVLVSQGPVDLSAGRSWTASWRTERPTEHRWHVQLLDEQGHVIARAGTDGSTAVTSLSPVVMTPMPSSASTPLLPQQPVWDPRLNDLGVRLVSASPVAGQPIWRLIEARWESPEEAGGLHHVFIRLLDEEGRPVIGQRVQLLWGDGSAETQTDEAGANFPLYGPLGEYSVQVAGISDRVVGLGLPQKRHVNYRLTFQRMTTGR
ncbi:MAG: DUF5107 domain-containing protein [Anaerolineae bacterium]|nr:DUF5107 domain-containing protein [Anaerolineae bacterium]MDW8099710.1 DUF5107 domain-containing protein [Anaerolineae bacterium]